MHIEIARGPVAKSLLQNDRFISEWGRLNGLCPWSTSFQGPQFAQTWYGCYESRYEPIIVYLRKSDELQGLLSLAVRIDDGELVNVGDRQAEYQSWICLQDLAQEFPWLALRAVRKSFRNSRLAFRYLPPGVPLDWMESVEPGRVCRIDAHARPLLRFGDGAEIERSLRKKSNKSRLNRLRKLGSVEFRRVSDPEEFEQHIDDVMDFYDFRQGAVHNSLPFRGDDNKRDFHLAMLQSPELLHATILTVGDRLASAHLGMVSGHEVQLGVIVHSPFLSRYSPGKFHVLFLAQMLLSQGYEQLDLTPGGDPYKERFANARDQVHTLTVYPGMLQSIRDRMQDHAFDAGRALLGTLQISPKSLKAFVKRSSGVHPVATPSAALRSMSSALFRHREMRIYRYAASQVLEYKEHNMILKDRIADLLSYRPAERWQSKSRFLSTSLKRLEKGLHVYTCSEKGRLLHYGWLIKRQERSLLREVNQEYHYPPNSACLYDFYTFPSARGRGIYTSSIRKMLSDAARIPGTEWIYSAVLADNYPSLHVIEKIGFCHVDSLFEDVRFGRARQWNVPTAGKES